MIVTRPYMTLPITWGRLFVKRCLFIFFWLALFPDLTLVMPLSHWLPLHTVFGLSFLFLNASTHSPSWAFSFSCILNDTTPWVLSLVLSFLIYITSYSFSVDTSQNNIFKPDCFPKFMHVCSTIYRLSFHWNSVSLNTANQKSNSSPSPPKLQTCFFPLISSYLRIWPHEPWT